MAVRFSAVLGPWRYGGGGGPTQRFKEMLEHSLKREPASFPSSRQEYVYSKDAAEGCFLAAHADKASLKKRVYNISMGRVYGGDEIKSIVEATIPGSKVELSRETATGIHVDRMEPSDLTASKQEIGFVPKFDMAGAIEDYVGWLKGHGY